MIETKKILAVGFSSEEFDCLAPAVDQPEFEVDRFPSAEGALELVTRQSFDVLLVRYSLVGTDLKTFLETVRGGSSRCRRAPLVLLTGAGDSGEDAARYIGQGASRVLRLTELSGTLYSTLAEVLYVAPRRPASFDVQLEVEIDGCQKTILCRAENSSSTGILLATDQRLPMGTSVHFECHLPIADRPVAGEAEIIRHTLRGRDPVEGMGMRILSFAGDSQRLYEEFLRMAN